MVHESGSSAQVALGEGRRRTGRAIGLGELSKVADEVRDLIAAGQVRIALDIMHGLHPADMGLIIAGLPGTSRDALLRVMSPDTVTWMLRQMNPVEAGRVGARLGLKGLAFVLNQVHPQQALATLRRLPLPRARRLAETLEDPLPAVESDLLAQTPNTAGALMVAEYPAVPGGESVGATRSSVSALGEERFRFTHVYVLGPEGGVTGQIAMVDLAIAQDETSVDAISRPVVASVTAETSAKECARLRRHYSLTQLPVVEDDRLVGVILGDSLLGAMVEQDTRQMLQVASVAGESADGPVLASLRTRFPWLTLNLATTFLAAATIALFESTLARVVVLAAFLPVVAGQGGIGGTQTLTLIVRAIALGELVGVTAKRLLVREALLGILHGILLGLMVAAIAFLWKGNLGLALVLGVAMLGNMIIAGSFGAGVPLFLRRVGVDPAVASAVIVTTATDVFGFLLFLGIATAAIELIE